MIFTDSPEIKDQLFPFTLTREIADIRIGILTIREKWKRWVPNGTNITIPSNLLPDKDALDRLIAGLPASENTGSVLIQFPWHIFQYNDKAIRADFELVTRGRVSHAIPSSNNVMFSEQIFLEEGAKCEHCILNASTGPIYIGRNAEIMEGSIIRGPFAMCEGSVVKMGTKIYGATTLGPYCVAGGEIKNSVLFGFSNKAHDGYLGDSVLGEWCNLGAGTSNSNLKNTVRDIHIKNPLTGLSHSPGLKCGLIMGDYSRSAINTSFNTATITGVCCNIFGHGLTNTYIPSFTWGMNGDVRYSFEKAIRDAEGWKQLKKHSLTTEEISTLRHIFDTL